MDITKDNFIKLLPEISDTIRDCDFIAIDTELSGLQHDRNNNRFDVPEERFAKAVETSRGFFIMQFGLSCFTRDSNIPIRYNNKTYNFYIFPQPNSKYGDKNRTLSIQVQSIQFLTEHGFDFNKLFKEGVTYLTFREKQNITAQLKCENKTRSKVQRDQNGLPVFVPQSMRENCRDWMTKVKSFVDQRINSMDTTDTDTEEDKDKLKLRSCSSAHKRNIFRRVLECEQFYESILIENEHNPSNEETYLVITYVDKEDKKDREKNELISAKGFLEVLELIILNKKPIVGHNLALDIIQLISQFVEPLTGDYSTFKMLCSSLFPLIYDTKYIATLIIDPETLTSNQTRLQDLFGQLGDSDEMPKIEINHVNKSENDKTLPHQAGYDAYMCGYSFIVLCESYLRERRKEKSSQQLSSQQQQQQEPIAIDPVVVEEFANKIHLSFSYDYKYFNIGGDDEEPNRDHVLYLEHPDTWILDDIFQLFHPYGGVTVGHLSKTTALCALREPKQLAAVLSKAKKMKGSNYTIHSYESYLENFKRAK